jgi:hypothetical protein
MVLTLMALAGTAGLPFVDDIEDIIDGIGQWMGYATNTKKSLRKYAVDLLGKDLANVAQYGVSGIPGMPLDIAGRIGFQNVIPGSALLKTSEPDKTRSLIQILGPAASVLQSGARAIEDLATGKPALHTLLMAAPTAIQNVAKGADMFNTGVYRDMLGRKVMDVNALDSTLKTIGFQPEKVAAESRLVQQNQQDISMERVIESSIVGQWAQGIYEKDPDRVAKARAQLVQWNADNPDLRIAIRPGQVADRVKQMALTREQRFVRAAPPEVRGGVLQDLRP